MRYSRRPLSWSRCNSSCSRLRWITGPRRGLRTASSMCRLADMTSRMAGSRDRITFGSGGRRDRMSTRIVLLGSDQIASIFCVTSRLTWQSSQILDVSHLFLPRPLHHPRLLPFHLSLGVLHQPPRIRWPRRRSLPSSSAGPGEPARPILQGIPAVCSCRVDPRRCDEDELLLLQQGTHPLGVPDVRYVPVHMRLLPRCAVLDVRKWPFEQSQGERGEMDC